MSDITAYGAWLAETAGRADPDDRLGTAGFIDAPARLRGRDSIVTGQFLRLSRPLPPAPSDRAPEAPMVISPAYEPSYMDLGHGTMGFGIDRLEVACHGYAFTHMDGLNHILLDGHLYGGRHASAGAEQDVAGLAEHCFFTRAVVADIPTVRGTPWVDADRPVTGDDLDAALAGTRFEPGDALVLYMGRDRYEAAGHVVATTGKRGRPGERRPGVGAAGARWIADHGVAALCWDLQDALHDQEPQSCVHLLIYAVGLVIVDNCHLADAASAMRQTGRRIAGLVVQPVGFPAGTGSLVEPFLVL